MSIKQEQLDVVVHIIHTKSFTTRKAQSVSETQGLDDPVDSPLVTESLHRCGHQLGSFRDDMDLIACLRRSNVLQPVPSGQQLPYQLAKKKINKFHCQYSWQKNSTEFISETELFCRIRRSFSPHQHEDFLAGQCTGGWLSLIVAVPRQCICCPEFSPTVTCSSVINIS